MTAQLLLEDLASFKCHVRSTLAKYLNLVLTCKLFRRTLYLNRFPEIFVRAGPRNSNERSPLPQQGVSLVLFDPPDEFRKVKRKVKLVPVEKFKCRGYKEIFQQCQLFYVRSFYFDLSFREVIHRLGRFYLNPSLSTGDIGHMLNEFARWSDGSSRTGELLSYLGPFMKSHRCFNFEREFMIESANWDFSKPLNSVRIKNHGRVYSVRKWSHKTFAEEASDEVCKEITEWFIVKKEDWFGNPYQFFVGYHKTKGTYVLQAFDTSGEPTLTIASGFIPE